MKSFFLMVMILFVLIPLLYAQEIEQKRVILGIYDSSEGLNKKEDDNLIHNYAATILNFLGMKVRYHDIQNGLPLAEDMQDVHGILSWFQDSSIPDAEKYCRWSIRQIREGKKFVVFDHIGAYQDEKTDKEVSENIFKEFFQALDLNYEGLWTDNTLWIQLVDKETDVVEFERTLDGELSNYEKISSKEQSAKTYLKLKRVNRDDSESSVVVTTSKGGLALQGYVIFIDYFTAKAQWRINPFHFFEEAFALKKRPRFDTTTLLGKRIFYSHIDGDGFVNLSEVKENISSGQIIFDEILTQYDIPVTVSFIEAEVRPEYLGSNEDMALARQILELDNVEVGVHGFTHPLHWQNQWTAYKVEGFADIPNHSEITYLQTSNYPNAYVIRANRNDYLKREIDDVVDFHNHELAPQGKKVVIMQWTGDCEPPAEGIARTRRLGILNINRGDTRFDRSHPSYTGVAPLVRRVNGQIQVHSSNSNENLYTNLWEGPYYGFKYLTETFQQTEYPSLVDNMPRRITPINVYYHFYSGEKLQALQALNDVYDFAIDQNVIAIFTSRYVQIVEGFLSGRIFDIENGGWKFKNYQNLRTVRLDNIDQFPDLKKSKGILGFKKWEHYLYIHLDEGQEATLYLQNESPSKPYLRSSSSVLTDIEISKDTTSFQTINFSESVHEFVNMHPKYEYEVQASDPDNQLIYRKKVSTDKNGDLIVRIPFKGRIKVSVKGKT